MKEKIKIVCLCLVTGAILLAAGFYCWSVYENLKIEKFKMHINRVEAEFRILQNMDKMFSSNTMGFFVGEREVQNLRRHFWDLFNQ